MTVTVYPAVLGQSVHATLADGTETPAYWDGVQWWTGVDNDPYDIPIQNDFVVSWSPEV